MKIVAKTDIGKGRSENQDNYRAGRQKDDTVWAVVCDGMGGANGGALASAIAVEQMEETLVNGLQNAQSAAQLRSLLEHAAQQANTAVYTHAQKEPSLRGMGTTMVALILKNQIAYLTHAGDSRAYLYHAGTLDRLTRDHSMVQEMVENGTLTEDEAAVHPKKNLITRALGVSPALETEYGERRVRENDVLLLCSDGLTNFATEKELCDILENTEFFSTADEMIRLALDADGQDNITALLIKAEKSEES